MAEEQRRVTMEPMDGAKRGLATLLGLGGLGAGTIAVFESANQAGTVALLTIGALASVLAVLGKIPLRWVVAGTEVDLSYDESIQTADALSDLLTAEQLQLLTTRLLGLATQQQASTNQLKLAAHLSRASEVETAGHDRMKRFATLTSGWSYHPAEAEHGADGIMITPEGTRIAVEFKAYGDGLSRQALHQRVQTLNNRLPSVLERTGTVGLLVMLDSSVTTDQLGEFPSVLRRPMRIVTSADNYGFVLEKFKQLQANARTDQTSR